MQNSGDHRPEPPPSAPPIQMLAGFLDFLRSTLLWKLEGLDDEQLRRPGTQSGISLLAILKHSAWVERFWFQVQAAGRDVPMIWTADDPNADWRLEPEDTSVGVIEFYLSECERSREIIAEATWEEIAKGDRGETEGITIGWILTHMVEEVARHCGHADILREAIDGATGE